MPIIHIHLLEGRSDEQKRALVRRVTDAVVETANATPEAVRIVLQEMKPTDYAIAGTLIADQGK